MSQTRYRPPRILEAIGDEFASYPGRMAGSLRDTLGIILALVITMTLRVPGIALGLAALLLLQRERPGITMRSALQMIGGVALACAVSLFWVQLTDGTEVARFLGVVLAIFLAAFGAATTNIPQFFTFFGFYGFICLALWDRHRTTHAIVTTTLDYLASVTIVVLSATAVEAVFGTRHAWDDLEQEMRERLIALSRFYRAMTDESLPREGPMLRTLHHALIRYAHAGDRQMNVLYLRISGVGPALSSVPLGMHYRIGLLTRVIEKSVAIGFHALWQRNRDNIACCSMIADQCDQLLSGAQSDRCALLPPNAPNSFRDIYTELQQYAGSLPHAVETPVPPVIPAANPTRSFQLFLPGVFPAGATALYALKLALGSAICYVLYNSMAWPGIRTCVITVLFTGLSSTGAMKQKQTFLFAGAMIGGFLGIASVCLFFPNMDSITSLVVLVGAVSWAAAWTMRSPHIGYVGVQIAFAYFLTTLPDFSAETGLTPARDRVFGVGLGIVVMWFIFDQLWPRRTSSVLTSILYRVRRSDSELRRAAQLGDPRRYAETLSRCRVSVATDLAQMQLLNSAIYFDFGPDQKREAVRSRQILRKIELAAAAFYEQALQTRSAAPPEAR
jgi:multidrug resistance protein MdtO